MRKMNPSMSQNSQLLFGCLGAFLGGTALRGRFILGLLKLFFGMFDFGIVFVSFSPFNGYVLSCGVPFYTNIKLIQVLVIRED